MSDFSLPPQTHLGHICLATGNPAGSLTFYTGILGLRELERRGERLYLGVEEDLPLVVLQEEPGAQPKPRRTTGLYHLAILLPSRKDLARTLRQLSDNRYPLLGAADHRVSEALYLADPEGNGIEIYADRPRYLWSDEKGELEMTTEPLEVESLTAELREGDESWTGLPQGTSLGHVHLQVSNLAEAEVFYRELLGFDLMQRYDPGALFLSAGGYHHHIALNTWSGAGTPPPPVGAAGLRYFTVVLPAREDLEQVQQRLQNAGVEAKEGLEGILVHDPSRNGILLTEEHAPRIW